jgi:FkbH-like protein
MDFITLKHNLKKDFSSFKTIKIAVLGDSTTQLLTQALKGYGYNLSINFDVFEAGYDQIENEIFNPSSELYVFKPQFVIVFQSTQKLASRFYTLSNEQKLIFADHHIKKVETLYRAIQNQLSANIIYFNFPELNDGVYGNYGNKTGLSFLYQLRKINFELMNKSRELANLTIHDVCLLQSQHGFSVAFDPSLYINTDSVFSMDFVPYVVQNISQIIQASTGHAKKCLVLDLDNLLWGGVIGDDGMEKIQIGNLGVGKAFSGLQHWAKQLKERGIILAVCSKNTENIAKEPFEKHPEMILTLDDIAVFVANWNNKADNIQYIQSVLNIGFDSMVFLDDNPFERDLVRTHFPEIVVPELPEDPAEYLTYLQSLNLFETASITEEDSIRTRQYQEESQRKEALITFTSETDFLQNIEMSAEVKTFNSFTIPRVAQLIQRSNQFNLRTIRYSDAEINTISSSSDYHTLSVSLKDKFGDYGLVAVVILKLDNNKAFIDTWIMSCRILKRGVENLIVDELVKFCSNKGYTNLVGEYIATAKNGIVEKLYAELGFSATGSSLWMLDIKEYQSQAYFIKVAH